MNSIIRKIKIIKLSRQLAKVEGNLQYYSKLIGRLEEKMKKRNSVSLEYKEMDGSVKFNRIRVVWWTDKRNELRLQLSQLGVLVRDNI